MFFHLIFLMCFCVNHNYGAYIYAMDEEEYQIISSLTKDGRRFLMPLQERTKAQKTAYVKYWRLKVKLSIDENGLLLFEGKKVLKNGEIKKCVKKTFSKSKSVGYKKIRTQALDGYAGLRRNNILTVTLNDAEFKKFTNKAAPRQVTATEVSYHYIYTPIFIFILSSLTEETFVTETFARSKNPRDSWINFCEL